MTRRVPRTMRTLSIDGYVHRATVGLPRAQRLDAAAELRTHLMERVAEHHAQGFSLEEAEYLAVRGMGEPQRVNRSLLGHAFTHRAGWAVLALLVVGGVGWYAQREWMPPRVGVWYEKATPEDISRLFADGDAPRGTYQAVILTFPRGTRSVVYATVASAEVRTGNEDVAVYAKDLASQEAQNIVGRVPGSYRSQERLLLTTWPMTCTGQDRSGIFVTGQTIPSRFWNAGSSTTSGIGRTVGACNNPSVKLNVVRETLNSVPPQKVSRSVLPFGANSVRSSLEGPEPLALGQWTVLMRLNVDPAAGASAFEVQPAGGFSAETRGVYMAVLPLDRAVTGGDGYRYGRGVIRVTGDTQDLPRLPDVVPRSDSPAGAP
ncbi:MULTISPECIES: permease prefix domain 1-containing protein [Deinococcus]|uniref:Permease prefix domain 1-containing protein n=1 Tax=Deinococcus rufus TaxID=2136097 RepID=A0ABV7Z8D7_9DEIO|nr:permease prefix domain 1-containing protein [Deinococcus sp. AB2017081]WQE96462.1 permease prefix domain 1-containing protein [Deinococcus sp. AB2017081]